MKQRHVPKYSLFLKKGTLVSHKLLPTLKSAQSHISKVLILVFSKTLTLPRVWFLPALLGGRRRILFTALINMGFLSLRAGHCHAGRPLVCGGRRPGWIRRFVNPSSLETVYLISLWGRRVELAKMETKRNVHFEVFWVIWNWKYQYSLCAFGTHGHAIMQWL